MGSKNHELVSVKLIKEIASLRSGSKVERCISDLAKSKCVTKIRNAKCKLLFK